MKVKPPIKLKLVRNKNTPELIGFIKADLIKQARANIESNRKPEKGELVGNGPDVALLLFVDRYNKVHETTDKTIAQHILDSRIPLIRKINISDLFKQYKILLQHTKILKSKNKDKIDNTIDTEWMLKLRSLQATIYLLVLHLVYDLQYKLYKKASDASATTKRKVKDDIYKILSDGNYKRPIKIKNPISEIISRIKQEYKTESGRDFPKSNRTLENWIYEYFNPQTTH